MGQDGPWLNESGSPRAAGSPCAAAGPFSVGAAALLAALMGLLVLATVLGNALVVLAFAVERSLRTQGNFFFLNLALADLLVGGFCIPLYIPYVLTGEWRLGRGLCKLWLVVDYLVCTASVFNIVLISFDRFVSVTRAVRLARGQGDAILKMVTVWIAAFLLYGPAILSWEHIAQKSILPEGECHAEFFYNWYFLMIASTIEFFTPFVTVTYFNVSIYLNIRKRTSFRSENLPPGQDDCEVNFQGKKREHNIFFVKSANTHKHEERANSLSLPKPQALKFSLHNTCNTMSRGDTANIMTNKFRLSRDKRVAKSLAIIVCVFGVCWAPYTLLMIIRAACHGQCVHYSLYEASFWLLWVNSAINPVLYPLCHISFRSAFIKLLCPGKAKIHPHVLM
uniref:Histamine H3 receptor n=1 Tax=Nothoprocta perdicaria TaxID=30464 RepID=A0A8C7EFV3_NOTPE